MNISVAASVNAIRAIGSELAWRLVRQYIVLGLLLAAILLALGGWLTAKDALWWILEGIFIAYTALFLLLVLAVRFLLQLFSPSLTARQKKAIQQYVDKLQRVADTLGISRFVLLFRIVRDIVRPTEQPFIKQIANDSTTLHSDFIKLQKLFQNE